MDFWTRARGADLLALASTTRSCADYATNECAALLMLVSHMPLPNTDDSSSILFMEEIGVMAFIEDNIDGIRTRLTNSVRDMYSGAGSLNIDNAGLGVYRGFARNWVSRFPQIINNPALRGIIVRQRLAALELTNPPSRRVDYVSMDIDRRSALSSAIQQFARYSPESLRRGVSSVSYRGENAGGQGLANEFYSVITSAVVGSSDEALFQTHEQSGFERIIAGRVHPDGYRTFGRFMGIAAATGNPAGIPLPPIFFRRLLGQAVALNDVREFDEDWYNIAVQIMRLSSDEEIRQLTLGDPEPLQGSGLDEPLTMANRDYQMQRAIENIVTNNSPDQFAQIAEGFFSVVPRDMFDGIDGEDVQVMVVGNLDVSASDLIASLDIQLPATQAGWLRQVIGGLTPYLRQRFLRFVTGFSVVPIGGWAQLGRLRVDSVARIGYDGLIAMPRGRTCFRTLNMPLYDSFEEMQTILTNVLTHAIESGMEER